MNPGKLVSLPTTTAIHRILDGHFDGTRRLGIRFATHAALHDFFGEAGIEVAQEPSISKKIRATVDRLNKNLEEHGKLKGLLNQMADGRHYELGAFEPSIDYLNERLRADGFEIRPFPHGHRLVSIASNTAAANQLQDKARALELNSVNEDFARAVEEAERNPTRALTAACSTVESVCKCILDELGCPYPAKQDIQHLSMEVATHLGLSPSRSDLPAQLLQDLKQILGGLQTVAGGLGSLRTHAGDAHGRGKLRMPVDSRIARLAIHSASALSLFYIETFERIQLAKTTKRQSNR